MSDCGGSTVQLGLSTTPTLMSDLHVFSTRLQLQPIRVLCTYTGHMYVCVDVARRHVLVKRGLEGPDHFLYSILYVCLLAPNPLYPFTSD